MLCGVAYALLQLFCATWTLRSVSFFWGANLPVMGSSGGREGVWESHRGRQGWAAATRRHRVPVSRSAQYRCTDGFYTPPPIHKKNGDSFGWLPLDTLIVNISVLNSGTRSRSSEYPTRATGMYTPIEQVGLQLRTNLAKINWCIVEQNPCLWQDCYTPHH